MLPGSGWVRTQRQEVVDDLRQAIPRELGRHSLQSAQHSFYSDCWTRWDVSQEKGLGNGSKALSGTCMLGNTQQQHNQGLPRQCLGLCRPREAW